MKKNISINISGTIFHIEEDGYDQLKNYLESITRFFSTYEDSEEIIADIENRIAEIFTEKLSGEKQVITAEDVTHLIATMGTISDFKAVEDDEYKSSTTGYSSKKASSESTNSGTQSAKKLVRDERRKLIGGVAAGIANYIGTDPIWIRLAIIAVFFGISFIPALSGFTAVCYIVLWIVLPGSVTVEEEENLKKLYRDPDNKVISGVCGGLGAYFGTEVTLIRILFVIGVFLGGSTVVLYIILWAITPEANTITERMKMQGEPVTLSNIEENLKKNLNLNDDKNENILTKLLLIPFRAIAVVFEALGRALGPFSLAIGELVRVLLGILLIIIPIILFFGLVGFVAIIFGVADSSVFINNLEFPFETLFASIPKLAAIAISIVFAIPLIFLVFAGVSLLRKRSVLNRAFSMTLLGFFLMAVVFSAITVPAYVLDFRREAKVVEEETFTIPAKTFQIKANPNDEMEYNKVRLYLHGYSGNSLKLVKEYSSRGRSRKDASKNAKMIDYNVVQVDSSLIFDLNFIFNDDAAFRGQELILTLYIPYGKEFVVQEHMDEIIRVNDFSGNNYYYQLEGNRWIFEESGLKCLTCQEQNKNIDDDIDFDFHSDDEHYKPHNEDSEDNDFSFDFNFDKKEEVSSSARNLSVIDFTGLSVSGLFLIHVAGDRESVSN